ncbi:TPA: aminoacetone oxidase family FAD-binding enzyme, partial [Candidatus Gracilibacteria bacterium]|nr:aminoacetone oxidase family FAD-binding enzyme [Candidatus Gracilibacteria bacterium]
LNPNTFFSSNSRKKEHFFKSKFFEKSDIIHSVQQFSVISLFDELEIKYFWEKNRAMLKSENARSDVEELQARLEKIKNIFIHVNTEINSIKTSENNTFIIENKTFDNLVITTGGMLQMEDKKSANSQLNKQKTYGLLEQFGHTIVKTSPSLSPFRFSKKEIITLNFAEVAGQSFTGKIYAKNVNTKKNTEILDDILITHLGLSGPAILDFSALWDKKSDVFLNFIPEYTEKTLTKKLQDLRNGKNNILSFFRQFVSKKLAKFLIEKTKITHLFFADITKQELKNVVSVFCAFALPKPELFPYQACWTTKGGVSLSDINISTLESKKISHLFIAGEILDIDGLCGGYHISLCALQAKIISENV